MAARRREVPRRFARSRIRGAKAHGDDRDPGELAAVFTAIHEVRVDSSPCLNEVDAGVGGDGIAHSTSSDSSSSQTPLLVHRGQIRTTVLAEFHEARRVGQAERPIELGQVAALEVGARAVHEARVVVNIDDGDGLSGSIALDPAESDLVNAVRRSDLLGCEAARVRLRLVFGFAIRTGWPSVPLNFRSAPERSGRSDA